MGVDSVESSSRQKAAKNSIDKGVAGRSMMAKDMRDSGSPETGSQESVRCWVTIKARHSRGRCAALEAVENGPTRGRSEVKRATIGVAQAMLAVALVPRWKAHSRLS